MSPLTKFVAIVALPCLLASAAECQDGQGSCAQTEVRDETMLVQVGTMLKKLMDRSGPNADSDTDFKPLPQNKTKMDEAMKRKSANSGLPMTKHRTNSTGSHHTKRDDEKAPSKEENSPSKNSDKEPEPEPEPEHNNNKAEPSDKAIDKNKEQEEKEQDKMRKSMKNGGHTAAGDTDKKVNKEAEKMKKELKEQAKELGDALKHAMGGGDDKSDKPEEKARDSTQDRKNAVQAAIEQVDLQNLENAEAAKNAAMSVAANAAAAEDRVAMQLAAQAQKLADKNRVLQGNEKDQKQLAGAIASEVNAEMNELSVRSTIEKQALQDAMSKVDAAEKAAKQIATDAEKEAETRAR